MHNTHCAGRRWCCFESREGTLYTQNYTTQEHLLHRYTYKTTTIHTPHPTLAETIFFIRAQAWFFVLHFTTNHITLFFFLNQKYTHNTKHRPLYTI